MVSRILTLALSLLELISTYNKTKEKPYIVMKKKILSIFLCGIAAFSLTSCEDYFDDVPNNATSLEDVFANRGQTLKWLTNVYSYMPDSRRVRWRNRLTVCWRSASMEGYLPWDNEDNPAPLRPIILGTMDASTGVVQDLWVEHYRAIQYANIYLAHVDECDPLEEKDKLMTKAECRALRAYYYFDMMKEFGPVPIVGDKIYGVDDPISDMSLPRNTVDECFDYIISELKDVINSGNLASQFDGEGAFNTQYRGNITKEAAEGILSEVYLYRASNLFNGDSYYQSMKNPDGTLLFPQSKDMTKWEDARDAAKAIIESGKFSLVLRNNAGTKVDDVSKSCPYNSCWYASLGSNDNEEMIVYNSKPEKEDYPLVPRHQGIDNAQTGAGAYSVPLQFVDMFFTKKGLRIEEDPDYWHYDSIHPTDYSSRQMTKSTEYKDQFSSYSYFKPGSGKAIMKQFYDREPRFYLCITFQNRQWSYDTQRTYYTDMSFGGNSGANGNTHDYPLFGTIGRKVIQKNAVSSVDNSILLRLSEVYLNYAEACCELGDLATAIKYVNKIRSRAGVAEYVGLDSEDQTAKDKRGQTRIDLGELTQDLVRKVVYRERIIELAFENKYYFDVRRWGVADMAEGDGWIYPKYHKGGEGGNILGFNIQNEGSTEEQASSLNFYKRVVAQTRIYTKRMSFLPIPQTEVNRDVNMVQNEGWASSGDSE